MARAKLLFGLVLCAGFIALGIYLQGSKDRNAQIIGGANIVFFSVLLIIALYKIIKKSKT